jgi:FkbM family methyltransferase
MSENIVSNLVKGVYKKIKNSKPPYRKAGFTWLQMRRLNNMPEGKVNQVRLLGKTISVYGRIGFLDAVKEIFFQEIYKINLTQEPFIIDCGANIGLSVIYFKHHYPKARIIAFEPDARNYNLLKQNVSAFGLSEVELRNEAIWIENTELSFSNEGTMSSKIIEKGDYKIRGIRLKDLLINPVDLLKIDIEGAEYEVVKDIQSQLHLVKNLFIEYHGKFYQNKQLLEILDIVTTAGFSFYIKEATSVYDHPFMYKELQEQRDYDLQLNIFCFRQ